MTEAVMIVPNTKDGMWVIKYLSKQLIENNILIKLVNKKEFDSLAKVNKCPAHTKVNHCHSANEICIEEKL